MTCNGAINDDYALSNVCSQPIARFIVNSEIEHAKDNHSLDVFLTPDV
jgi:hypothetical protein